MKTSLLKPEQKLRLYELDMELNYPESIQSKEELMETLIRKEEYEIAQLVKEKYLDNDINIT